MNSQSDQSDQTCFQVFLFPSARINRQMSQICLCVCGDCSMSGITCYLRLCGGSSFLTEFLGVMSVWDLMERLAVGHQQAG